MRVVILCGGEGIRLKGQLDYVPKGMVFIDSKPVIWHIMKRYSLFGYNEFILALGKNGQIIRDYFLNYNLKNNDIEILLGKSEDVTFYSKNQEEDWKIIFTDTGNEAHTGARLLRCKRYIDTDNFMLTYSDCLADVDIGKLVKSHNKKKYVATVTGVNPPYRYGEFVVKDKKVTDFVPISKLSSKNGYVNGGYMVLNNKIFDYLDSYNECTLEGEVFKKLVSKEELNVFEHRKFWQCLDNDREYECLKKLCENNQRFWLKK